MKKVLMDISEFLRFRQIAELYRISFTYGIKSKQVTVCAKAEELAEIGY